MERKTIETFLNEVYSLVKDEYTVLSTEYINTNTKVLMKHNICNNTYEVTPNKFLSGRRCPYCKGIRITNSNSKSNEEFLNELYNIFKDEYTPLETYIKTEEPILIRHNICGYEYKTKPKYLLNGNGCPECAKINRRIHKTKSHITFINEVNKVLGDDYTVLSEYTHSKSKVLMKHNICNNTYEVTPNILLSHKTRCPYCYGNNKEHLEFIDEVKEKYGDEYTVLGTYINNKTKIAIKHNICGKISNKQPNGFLNGKGCIYCSLHKNSSKNELLIEEYLTNNDIKFIREFTNPTCKDKRLLRFDFYLEDYNLIIELDGSQHYIPGWYKFEDDKFNINKLHDKIKNEWCKDNNIDLLRISYKEDNVKVLDNYLKDNYIIIDE